MGTMMQRVLALILTTWMLAANPALCLGGVLPHMCACVDCEQGSSRPCPEGHGCQDDPCRPQITASGRTDPSCPCHEIGVQNVYMADVGDNVTSFASSVLSENQPQGFQNLASPSLSAHTLPLLI